jgi:hypothetical protein
MLDCTTSAKSLPVEPLTSPLAPSPLSTMPAIRLLVLVGLEAVPALPLLLTFLQLRRS